MQSLLPFYNDTLTGDFSSNEEKVVTFSLVDLDPGGYIVAFRAEQPIRTNISNPPIVGTFGYTEAVEEQLDKPTHALRVTLSE